MRGSLSVAVEPAGDGPKLEFRMIAAVRLNDGDVVDPDVFLDHNGAVDPAGFVPPQPCREVVGPDLELVNDEAGCRREVLHRLPIKQDVEGRAVFDQRVVEPIDDGSARGHDLDVSNAVLLGLERELASADDLKLPQTSRHRN